MEDVHVDRDEGRQAECQRGSENEAVEIWVQIVILKIKLKCFNYRGRKLDRLCYCQSVLPKKLT